MKTTFKTTLFFAASLAAIVSCKEQKIDELIENNQKSKSDTIEFMGEKVIVNQDFPTQFLNQTQDEFVKYYQSANESENLRTDGNEPLSLQDLSAIITPLTKKYPDVSIDKEISAADQKRIFADFPGITSIEQIREKSAVILAYYEALLKEEAVPAVIKFKKEKAKDGLRTSGIGDPFGHMDPYEESVAMNHPRYVPGYALAAALAKEMGDRYGPANYGQKGDAVRHGAWNCLTIRNTVILGASRDGATNYAQECITAHEIDCSTCYEYDLDTAMDLFNNISARTWMRSQISWGVGVVRDMPTESKIETTMRSWGDNAGLINKIDYLNHIVLGGNNQPNDWGLLYGAGTWQFQHLMYYEP